MDEKTLEERRNLFGSIPPLLPSIISQDNEVSEIQIVEKQGQEEDVPEVKSDMPIIFEAPSIVQNNNVPVPPSQEGILLQEQATEPCSFNSPRLSPINLAEEIEESNAAVNKRKRKRKRKRVVMDDEGRHEVLLVRRSQRIRFMSGGERVAMRKLTFPSAEIGESSLSPTE